MTVNRTVLVSGATGNQGGAVARALLGGGWQVRAIVRDPAARAARSLEKLGARLIPGDLDDPGSLRDAARDVHGVFSVQPSDMSAPDPELEVRRGKNLAAAAAAAGVAHLVYSSVASADRASGVAHFETKREIESHIEALGVPVTVLRPVYFMENWRYLTTRDADGERVVSIPLDADTSLQMIAVSDIGRIAAAAFTDPAGHLGESIEIAGDECTVGEIVENFAAVDGVPTRLRRLPIEQVRSEAVEFARMYEWLNAHGHRADIAMVRGRYPGMQTFDAWVRSTSHAGSSK
ncbi:NmrA/HSCARG family protein [Nocardia higoensis]|uniref:NmrA/HSCARG family protein n=1 Tax=Nocardia higoensis TaxID=228599 RepID=UPI0002D4C8AC|nr:NmrA/HSCARG family protein [Nocardia higoensis]